MTSFAIQSQFLDLKKIYQNFSYKHLINKDLIINQNTTNQQNITYEGMTQNTYLFIQEKYVLIYDIENIAIYFQYLEIQKNVLVQQQDVKCFPFDKVRDRVCFIFQKYQQQPCLLDTLLQQLILPIMGCIKKYLSKVLKNKYNQQISHRFHSILLIIYQLIKVRGKKYIIQYFPHQTKDLYPLLGYLVQYRHDNNNWQSQYVILLWLGVIVLLPFNLDTLDSQVVTMQIQNGQIVSDIVSLMLGIGKYYLSALTKIREASALFLSKLFTRPDIQKQGLLAEYIRQGLIKLAEIKNNNMQNSLTCGIIYSFQQIYKRVQRSQLLHKIDPTLQYLRKQRQQLKQNVSKKQLKIKLLTQIGLVYLKPRNATWAYKKINKCLGIRKEEEKKYGGIQTNTLKFQQVKIRELCVENNEENDVKYYEDVNKENLEQIIDMLIEGLNQKQTIVREKASKGLGKIAGRLSKDMVVDIVDYILVLIPNPQTQHAVCLTLAEFIKRNLIAPQRVSQMYQFMRDSLLYQQQQGGYSVGQAVRDAACYMTWSVARGYQQGGQQLGISLMIAACFDREVGCRRAASAAYQQLVGRVGDVPNGIQILTEADYFTLGLQKNAYLNVAIFVSSFERYFKPFVENLCYEKLRHWDLQIKRIAACSLSLMCPLNPEYIGKQIIPCLAKYINQQSNNVRLGAIIGLGEILLGLKGYSMNHQLQNQMKDSVFLKSLTQNQKKLIKAGEYMEEFKNRYKELQSKDNFYVVNEEMGKEIVVCVGNGIKQGKIYKGKSGENFRIYTLRLIQCFAMCGMNLDDNSIAIFYDFIQQNIKNQLQPIILAAVKCLKAFLTAYYKEERDVGVLKNLITSARSSSKALSMVSKGYTLSLSKLTLPIYVSHILDTLEINGKVCKQNDDPQKRKYAIMGIEALVEEIGFSTETIKKQEIDKIFNIVFQAMSDYTMDKRGDIGSIVREAAMSCLMGIIKRYTQQKAPTTLIDTDLVTTTIGLLLQQLSQKIDRIRLLSGSLLQSYFDTYSPYFQIPNTSQLSSIFSQQNIKKLIKQNQSKIDNNLQTEVIKIQMKIQEDIFMESDKYLIYFWNVPHLVFSVVVPLMKLERYSGYILKGLCTSAGGISESIIKYSLQEIGKYVTYVFDGHQYLMENLMKQILLLMKSSYRDERIIVPLFKTLDFILEREQVMTWQGIHKYDEDLFRALKNEIGKTKKNILKVSAVTGPYVSLLSLNNPRIRSQLLQSIINILCSNLPKARKLLADKLLLVIMSQDDNKKIFSQECSELLMTILSDNDFLDQKLDVGLVKAQIQSAIMG